MQVGANNQPTAMSLTTSTIIPK